MGEGQGNTILVTMTPAQVEEIIARGIQRYEELKAAEVEWLTRKQVARELGVSISTLSRWADIGLLKPDGQIGRTLRYSRASINKHRN